MVEENIHNEFAYPVIDNMVQGSVTRVMNGYLAQDLDGNAFVISDNPEALEEVLAQAGRSLAKNIIKDLEHVDNAQESISFTFMVDEPYSDYIPANVDPQTRKALIQVLSNMKGKQGVGMNTRIPYTGSKHARPQPFQTQGNPMANMNEEATDPVEQKDMDKIHESVEKGDTVIIKNESKHNPHKKKHY